MLGDAAAKILLGDIPNSYGIGYYCSIVWYHIRAMLRIENDQYQFF